MQPGAGVQRMSRKQQLLSSTGATSVLRWWWPVATVTVGVLVAWWLPLVLAVVLWAAHEAWFADHLFISA